MAIPSSPRWVSWRRASPLSLHFVSPCGALPPGRAPYTDGPRAEPPQPALGLLIPACCSHPSAHWPPSLSSEPTDLCFQCSPCHFSPHCCPSIYVITGSRSRKSLWNLPSPSSVPSLLTQPVPGTRFCKVSVKSFLCSHFPSFEREPSLAFSLPVILNMSVAVSPTSRALQWLTGAHWGARARHSWPSVIRPGLCLVLSPTSTHSLVPYPTLCSSRTRSPASWASP